jgi:predicted short-subunit dehydrogenase-like oxidoreductase (DUF2520 family)
VGAGRLGSALARALAAAGARVVALSGRQPDRARALALQLGAEVATPAAACERASWVFLCVPDDALPALAAALPFRAEQRVVHCSGALPLRVLAPARAHGALAGCLHPLQSFPERSGDASRFHGISCGIEADGVLEAELAALCNALGARTLQLAGVDRARYHAAAVLASNYVVAVSAAAARAFALAGLPPAQAQLALSPLTRATADNSARLPLAEALTGPIARGDVETVRRHLSALDGDRPLRELYRALGAELLRLPLALDDEQRRALQLLLDDEAEQPP